MTSEHKKIAVVTGANSGLGFETSLGLAKEGYTAVLAFRSEESYVPFSELEQDRIVNYLLNDPEIFTILRIQLSITEILVRDIHSGLNKNRGLLRLISEQ